MLGLITRLLGKHCTCASCSAVFANSYAFNRRELARQLTLGKPPAWDDDLSEHDLEVLKKAGFTEEQVRATVDAMQKLATVLVEDWNRMHEEIMRAEGRTQESSP